MLAVSAFVSLRDGVKFCFFFFRCEASFSNRVNLFQYLIASDLESRVSYFIFVEDD